jgi:hypothetical protein
MVTLLFIDVAFNTIVLVGAVIHVVRREGRASKEISQRGLEYLDRWRV